MGFAFLTYSLRALQDKVPAGAVEPRQDVQYSIDAHEIAVAPSTRNAIPMSVSTPWTQRLYLRLRGAGPESSSVSSLQMSTSSGYAAVRVSESHTHVRSPHEKYSTEKSRTCQSSAASLVPGVGYGMHNVMRGERLAAKLHGRP